MSSCFSVYSPLAPHHNLARYCIQASCPDPGLQQQQQPMHQVRTTFKPFAIALKSIKCIQTWILKELLFALRIFVASFSSCCLMMET